MKIRRSGIRQSFDAAGSLRVLLGPLRRLGEFLHDAVALELGDMVDEQHAVEMVDLVLDAGGEQAVGLGQVRLAVEVEILEPYLGGPLHVLMHLGQVSVLRRKLGKPILF